MLDIGLLLIGIGVIWYIAHAAIYNRFLRKHNPEIFDDSLRPRHSGKRSKKVTVVVTSGQTPAWIMLFGIPPIPIFLLGVVITIVTLIINAFQT
jgi:hypothetical protein